MAPKPIPDRWIPYEACGKVIEGTRFICFKVPLRQSVQRNVREIKQIWDIPTVLKDIPKLGAVIDLTNTARYYNPEDFLKANVLHRKILMPGRIIPPESSVKEFMNAADEFLGKDGDSLVGVHCTHGLNRTGYMVCRYMRDRLGIPAAEAIQKFETARGYEIERDIYRNDLLGKVVNSPNVGTEREIMPVINRRHDMMYRSPLGEEEMDVGPIDRYKRFGTGGRSNNDRFGYNNISSSKYSSNERKSGSNGLFSCYTDRYSQDRSDSRTRSEKDRASSSSWRNREDSSRSRRHMDNSCSGSKRGDRIGLVMPEFQRNNEKP